MSRSSFGAKWRLQRCVSALLLGPLILSVEVGCIFPAALLIYGWPDQIGAGQLREHRDPEMLAEAVVAQALSPPDDEQSSGVRQHQELRSLGLIISIGDAFGYTVDGRVTAVRATFNAAQFIDEAQRPDGAGTPTRDVRWIVYILRREVPESHELAQTAFNDLVRSLEPGPFRSLFEIELGDLRASMSAHPDHRPQTGG